MANLTPEALAQVPPLLASLAYGMTAMRAIRPNSDNDRDHLAMAMERALVSEESFRSAHAANGWLEHTQPDVIRAVYRASVALARGLHPRANLPSEALGPGLDLDPALTRRDALDVVAGRMMYSYMVLIHCTGSGRADVTAEISNNLRDSRVFVMRYNPPCTDAALHAWLYALVRELHDSRSRAAGV